MAETHVPDNLSSDARVFPIARMGKTFLFSTWVLLVMLAMLLVGAVFAGIGLDGGERWGAWIAAVLLAVALIATPLLVRTYSRPRCFEVSEEGMRIIWPGRTRKLPKGAFGEMRIVTRTELGRLIRRFGVGGVFGSFGWFSSEYMGNMDTYITRLDGLVYIRLVNRRPLLLTPEDPASFLEALREVIDSK